MIFVDSNVVIDILERDPAWFEWSIHRLALARVRHEIVANHIVLAELVRYADSDRSLESLLTPLGIVVRPFDAAAAFAAGQAFARYRRDGGRRQAILADFLIGGHALTLGAQVLTRDPQYFRRYFPTLSLIAPEDTDA